MRYFFAFLAIPIICGFATAGESKVELDAGAILSELELDPEPARALQLVKAYTDHATGFLTKEKPSEQALKAMVPFLDRKNLARLLQHAKDNREYYESDEDINPKSRKAEMESLVTCIRKLEGLLRLDKSIMAKVEGPVAPDQAIKEVPGVRHVTEAEKKEIEALLTVAETLYEKESYRDLIRNVYHAPELRPIQFPEIIRQLNNERKDTLLLITALKNHKENWFINMKSQYAELYVIRADRHLPLKSITLIKLTDQWKITAIIDDPYALEDSYLGMTLK